MSVAGPTTVCGLPAGIRACLFDLDGVLTDTRTLHVRAWTEMFDGYLSGHTEPFVPFDPDADYRDYVDGRTRYDGARAFLRSRGIDLPEGDPSDPPTRETVCGLANRKNELELALMAREGIVAIPGSVRYAQAARRAGLGRAVVSSSANCRAVLASAGIADLFDEVVDAVVARRRGLRGKPAPDTFSAAAQALGVDEPHAAVFEDATAGVTAGRSGGFGYVVGVDRGGNRDALLGAGADTVVEDLSELLGKTRECAPGSPDAPQ